jgi:YggT family protein
MELIFILIRLYEIVLIIRIIMSWINADTRHPFSRWILTITEPVLQPIRRMLPTNQIGIDFSPIIVFLLLWFLQSLLRDALL